MRWKNWTFLAMVLAPSFGFANEPLPDTPFITTQCVEFYNQNNFDQAFTACLESAHSNDVDAQYLVGKMYQEGKGTFSDYQKAQDWFQKAADKNHPEAELEIGKSYSTGISTPVNYQKAFQYFSKAAQQDIAQAQFLLALCYQIGLGTPMNYERAGYWFEQAQEKGFAILSQNDEQNSPIQPNKKFSIDDKSLPLNDRYVKAMQLIDSKQEDKRNQHIALLLEAAEQGHPKAQFQLGIHYFNGSMVEQNDAKALDWFTQAASYPYPPAFSFLAWMNTLGLGISPDYDKAALWFEKAQVVFKQALASNTSKKSDKAQVLANTTPPSTTKKAPQDPKLAFNWYQKAATGGDFEAQENVGIFYKEGKGVPQNFIEAYAWLNLAMTNGSKKAHMNRESLAQNMTPSQIESAQKRSLELYQAQLSEPILTEASN